MKIVVQRVSSACVTVEGVERAGIGRGILVLVGIERADQASLADQAADKIAHLRIFPGAAQDAASADERMQRSVLEISGEILVVSQFTLAGSIKKGRRPSFDGAALPAPAEEIYEALIASLRARGARVETGVFRAMMQVSLVNDGPVTFVLELAQ